MEDTTRPRDRYDIAMLPLRLRAKIRVTETCWIWTAATTRGYGSAWNGHRTLGAHIYCFQLLKGVVPEGMDVCHSCDNPLCVNPSHLFIGTRLDNMRDAVAKGRVRAGSRHGMAKLSESSVRQIKSQLASGKYTQKQIAVMHGVSRSAVLHINIGATWTK